jgi:Outer membrane protein beta-barrel domain
MNKLTILAVLSILVLMFAFVYAPACAGTNKFELGFGAGWASYSLGDINDHYIDQFARPASILRNNIDDGLNATGELGYFLTPRLSLHLGYIYLKGSTDAESRLILTDEYGNPFGEWKTKLSLGTSISAPALRFRYLFLDKDWDIFISGGGAWCFGKAVIKSEIYMNANAAPSVIKYELTRSGLGYFGTFGLRFRITDQVALNAEAGYRRFKTGTLRDSSGEEWIVDFNGPNKISLDMSGPYFLSTLSFGF